VELLGSDATRARLVGLAALAEGQIPDTPRAGGARHGAGFIDVTVYGAIYYPRWSPAARLMVPWDRALGRPTRFGAAFLALRAVKAAEQG